ncbi:MAG: protein adenylyltransferase SelO family protein, partial [Nitrospirae bacterium]|nr:protein adenylyltransferase SelO family protein [Nitrospirota bacterium]
MSKPKRAPARQGKQDPRRYDRFRLINGKHDFQKAVPEGAVQYSVRLRKGGKLAYFNYDLAKEMGLIAGDHPQKMNQQLSATVLETFGIQIINEYDVIHHTPIPKKTIKPNTYMATRYLQLQHPDKTGRTSGDGRSIWNGQISYRGTTWDVTSCGTGATCLSPATAIQKKLFKTGDPSVSYGCGYSDLKDGISAALLSEIFHRNGIATERTLAVIEYPKDISINVRTGTNLLRPSHLFRYLKQGDLEGLRTAVDYFIERQVSNGHWPKQVSRKKRYAYLAEYIAKRFAQATARFESDYLFVWLDWDGDNILMDGGIIDYGSVRQFGLYHHEYRYDDTDRWSTTIPEQKRKARYIVQTFIQLSDFLIRGKKNPIQKFTRHKLLKVFDQEFEHNLYRHLLYKIGFNESHREYLFTEQQDLMKKFRGVCSYFEKAKSKRGPHKVPDGRTWDAIYCMRDMLRELPVHLFEKDTIMAPEVFMGTIASSYANTRDRTLSEAKTRKIHAFQKWYRELVQQTAKKFKTTEREMLLELGMRASIINQYDRITGESILWVTEKVLRERKRLTFDELQKVIQDFMHYQKMRPDLDKKQEMKKLNSVEQRRSQQVMNKIVMIESFEMSDLCLRSGAPLTGMLKKVAS